MNSLGRCPELDGYVYWQNDHVNQGREWSKTKELIEKGSTSATIADSIKIANALCASAAKQYLTYKDFKSATYVNGTGNSCLVTY